MQNHLLCKFICYLITQTIAIGLIVTGVIFLSNQTQINSSMEIHFLGGYFKINSPNQGITLIFLGVTLILANMLFFRTKSRARISRSKK
jgi:hypothetical protein